LKGDRRVKERRNIFVVPQANMGTYHHSKVAIWTQVLWQCKFSRQQEANTTRRIRKDIEEEGKEGTSKTLLGDFGHILRNSE